MKPVLSVDIGSTWTKGAVVDLDGPSVLGQASTPTTVDDLTLGVSEVATRLLADSADRPAAQGGQSHFRAAASRPRPKIGTVPADLPLYLSSSAKGGLAIAAVGIVPDLTLHVARLAAASAGGKIVAHFAYRLTHDNLATLARLEPDIILLAGGTDGGNEHYNLHNAQMLASANLGAVVLYAGNSAVRSEVAEILAGRDLEIVDNLMPEIGTLAIAPAQHRIQEIFLRRIVEGKGLTAIAARCAAPIKPTPRAVLELIQAIAAHLAEWDDLLLIDMGGATTDVYSCTESFVGRPGSVLRGLCEPRLKRSVEGDLGMRINARWAAATGQAYVDRELAARGLPRESFNRFIERVSLHPSYLPENEVDAACDEILAGACLYHGLLRHAGSIEESYTAEGRVLVQRGKDLRRVRRWVGSGGYLARQRSSDLMRHVIAAIDGDTGSARLVPQSPDGYADADYLWPLLGNLAADYPAAAARLAVAKLVPLRQAVTDESKANRENPCQCLP